MALIYQPHSDNIDLPSHFHYHRPMADLFFIISITANGLLFIPQAINLYRQGHANEVSPVTFTGFLIIQFAYLVHGYSINDDLLFYGIILSIVTNSVVVGLIIYYRIKTRNFRL